MAWLATGYGRAPSPAPTSGFPLSVQDLFSQAQEPDYPQAPALINDASGLPPDQQKSLKREALLKAIAAALGGPPGQMGSSLLSAVANGGGIEDQAVDRANALAQQKFQADYQRSRVQAETMKSRQANATGQHTAEAVIGKAQHLWELSADDPNLQGRIATAAQRGPDAMEELSKLEASLPGRKALRAAGVDPDDPMAVEKAKADAKVKMEQQQKAEDLKAQNQSRMELEKQLRDQKLAGYKPEYHAPHEGSNVTAADGTIYHVVDGKVTGKVDIPGGARMSQQGLDPLREALRTAESEYRAMLIPKEQIPARAKELYALTTGGVEGLDAPISPPTGGNRAPRPQAPPPGQKKAVPSPNARLIPGVGSKAAAADFSAVSNPKARAWAEQQAKAGVPRSTIEAQLRKWGAL